MFISVSVLCVCVVCLCSQVGNIIRVENNQSIPADIMLVSTSEPNGLCYVETAELDGETNLKAKQCLNETVEMGQDPELLTQFNGEIVCEPPNNILNRFDGTLIWNNQRYAVDNDKILLRGCVLRNTQWCYGVLIFAGRDTKLMQNSGVATFKSTSIDRFLNHIIIGVSGFFYPFFLCVVPTDFGSKFHTFSDEISPNHFFSLDSSFSDCVILNFDMSLLYDRLYDMGNDDWPTF